METWNKLKEVTGEVTGRHGTNKLEIEADKLLELMPNLEGLGLEGEVEITFSAPHIEFMSFGDDLVMESYDFEDLPEDELNKLLDYVLGQVI